MLTDQYFGLEARLRDAKDQIPLQTPVEFERTYDAQVHEMVDAITAMVTGAQAGQNWLQAQPPNLEEVRQTLSSITNDGRRAYEIVVRLRALMKKASTVD